MKTLNNEQMKALQPYETHFDTAIRASWTRYPGREALEVMNKIYNEVSGQSVKLNASCGTCVLNLVRDCGNLYYESKKKEVAVATTGEEIPIKKVAVRTTTKRTTKK